MSPIEQAEGDLVQKDGIFYHIAGFQESLDGTLAVCENTDPAAVETALAEDREGQAGHRSFVIKVKDLRPGGKVPGAGKTKIAVWQVPA